MNFTDINAVGLLTQVRDLLLSWPVMAAVVGLSVVVTVALGFVQVRYFFRAWKGLLKSSSGAAKANADMTPFQAFLNMLSNNLGNGTIAGMATALYLGGPGAAFWVVAIGFLVMILRFSEVFLSIYFGARAPQDQRIGGPMLYLKEVVGGKFLAVIYAAFGLFFGLVAENALQANSISVSLAKAWNIPPMACAAVMLVFMLYVVFGGASRIVRISEMIVPVKVVVFLASAAIILVYHYVHIIPALQLIMKYAFSSHHAVLGGVAGYTVQQAISLGMTRIIMASESGLGTAALFFGKTGSVNPVEDALMSMLGTFITSFFCFVLCVVIIASGVWNSGETSTALTISAYNTVFGDFGGWIVSFLSVSFGLGVAVASAYFTKAFWDYFTGGRFHTVFALIYSGCFALGAIVSIDAVWITTEILLIGMLGINLYAIVALLPVIRTQVKAFTARISG